MTVRERFEGLLGPTRRTPPISTPCGPTRRPRRSRRCSAAGGHSSLWEVGFRVEVAATMVYDAMRSSTTHKLIDDGTMNGKLAAYFGTDDLYYFWPEREQQ